jgi:excisionase family DNA binding protein
MDEILNVKEVARLLRVSPVSVYRGLKNGRVPVGTKVNGQWRFLKSEIESWLKWGKR